MARRAELLFAHPRVIAGFLLVVGGCASLARAQVGVGLEPFDDVTLPAPAQVVIAAPLTPGAPDAAIALHTTISRCTVTPRADLLADSASIAFGSGLAPRDVAAADIDLDGRMDFLVTNATSGRVAILRQNTDGSFSTSYGPVAGSVPFGIASADFNADGYPDIVTANYGNDTASVLLNNTDGTFTRVAQVTTGSRPIDVAIGDFNNDGRPDFVTADQNSNAIAVTPNRGGNLFGPAAEYAVGSRPQSVVAADFDADGNLDLAVANGNSGSITILRGDGTGAFVGVGALESGAQPTSLRVGDLNLDGKLDLVAANAGQNHLTIFEGRGDLTFDTVYLPVPFRPSGVALIRLNDDPLPDLIVARADTPHFDLILNTSSYAGSECPGDVDGDLWVSIYDFAIFVAHFSQTTQALTNGDLNGDSAVDIYDFAILVAHFGVQCAES